MSVIGCSASRESSFKDPRKWELDCDLVYATVRCRSLESGSTHKRESNSIACDRQHRSVNNEVSHLCHENHGWFVVAYGSFMYVVVAETHWPGFIWDEFVTLSKIQFLFPLNLSSVESAVVHRLKPWILMATVPCKTAGFESRLPLQRLSLWAVIPVSAPSPGSFEISFSAYLISMVPYTPEFCEL